MDNIDFPAFNIDTKPASQEPDQSSIHGNEDNAKRAKGPYLSEKEIDSKAEMRSDSSDLVKSGSLQNKMDGEEKDRPPETKESGQIVLEEPNNSNIANVKETAAKEMINANSTTNTSIVGILDFIKMVDDKIGELKISEQSQDHINISSGNVADSYNNPNNIHKIINADSCTNDLAHDNLLNGISILQKSIQSNDNQEQGKAQINNVEIEEDRKSGDRGIENNPDLSRAETSSTSDTPKYANENELEIVPYDDGMITSEMQDNVDEMLTQNEGPTAKAIEETTPLIGDHIYADGSSAYIDYAIESQPLQTTKEISAAIDEYDPLAKPGRRNVATQTMMFVNMCNCCCTCGAKNQTF